MTLDTIHMSLDEFQALYFDGASSLEEDAQAVLRLVLKEAGANQSAMNEKAEALTGIEGVYTARVHIHVEYVQSVG